ncbi:hypothetical protein GQR58_030324 [Nymphon striatum]|nr:hypothetical protein GQR58_030324 [Nymphon striatum]
MRKLITTLALTAWMAPSVLGAQDVRLDAPDSSDELRSALTAASLSLALSRDGADAPQDYIAAARADYRRLLTGLYSEGYYGGTISILVDGIEASRIDPLMPRNSVSNVVLSVTTGPRFTFGRADIAPLARGTELPEAFSTGNVARSDDIGDAARAAVSGWRDVGHPLADTSGQSITARHPDEQLDVTISVDPGPELTFGNVTVTGNEAVRTERVLAIAGVPTGTFDPAMITRAEANLRRTGAFSSAAITEGTAPDGTMLPLTLSVVEQTPRRVGAGIEYSTVSDFYVNASAEQLDEPSFFERDAHVEAGIIRRIRDDVVLEYGLGYAVGEISDSLGDRNYSLFYAPIEGTKDRRDNALDPNTGYYANLLVSPFVGIGWKRQRTTEDDRDYITALIEDTISNDEMVVRLENFEGALSSEATADAITIADPDGVWLRLEGLTIVWNRSALLSGRVEVENLSAERIELIRLPATSDAPADLSSAQATPFSLPELPVSIDLNSVSANEIVLTEALLGEPITARFQASLQLGEGAGNTDFTLERTDGKTGRFIVDASFENVTRQLALNLLAQEGQDGIAARLLSLPDNPSVKLEIVGDAPLEEFTGQIALATDDVDRVTGTIVLSQPVDSTDQNFNIDLSGDLRPMLADQYDPFFGANAALRVQGTAPSAGGLQLSNLLIAADQIVLRGAASIDAQGWPETIDLRGRLGSGGANRVLLPIAGNPIEVSGMSLNVQYDEANGDAWSGAFDITSFTRAGVTVDALAISGGGVISPSMNAARGRFSADLNYTARGLAFDDAALKRGDWG